MADQEQKSNKEAMWDWHREAYDGKRIDSGIRTHPVTDEYTQNYEKIDWNK